jgi:uncharacterized small protein (DUF1192 family)
VTNANERPTPYRSHRSEFDHRAIDVTGHVLLGVVSLERRIAVLPKQISALVETAGRSGSSGRLWAPVGSRSTKAES